MLDNQYGKARFIKSPVLVTVGVFASIAVASIFFVLEFPEIGLPRGHYRKLSVACAACWTLILSWALYFLCFQCASIWLCRRRSIILPCNRANAQLQTARVPLVILYPTRDDFQEHACLSCLDQNFQNGTYRLVICDDSRDPAYVERVDRFHRAHPGVEVFRRRKLTAGKAGNLNEAITQVVRDEPWIVVLDADHILPRDYLANLSVELAKADSRVAFIQGQNSSDHQAHAAFSAQAMRGPPTPFQQSLGLGVAIHYKRDVAPRQRFGFLPLLGHGAAINRRAWETLGGFPHLMFEDYAFAFDACEAGWRGVYAEGVCSWEAFPHNFDSFSMRFFRYVGGGAQFVVAKAWKLLAGPASLVERIDLLMILLWYVILPILVINGPLTAFLCHELWIRDATPVHPAAVVLVVSLHLLCWVVQFSSTNGESFAARIWTTGRHWLWAHAVYTSCMPIASWRFCKHLFVGPTFERTPKGQERTFIPLRHTVAMVLLGVGVLALSVIWLSPFSPVLASHGFAYLFFPIYRCLNDSSIIGVLARTGALLPGVLAIAGLCLCCRWIVAAVGT